MSVSPMEAVPAPDPAGSWSDRLHRISGLVLLAYTLAWMTRIALIELDRGAFDAVVRAGGSLGARLVACAVWLALVRHGLGGLRVITIEALGASAAERWDSRLRAAVAFATGALALPGWALLLRPWIEGRLL